MNDITDLTIVKIGSLWFIPVNQSMRSVHLENLDPDLPNFGQPKMVSTSGHDQFHAENGKHHWVVVDIPALYNMDTRDMDDAIRHLDPLYRYLFEKGLVPDMTFPGVIMGDPFDLIPEMVG